MVEREATIHNKAGIHVRPSGVILRIAMGFPGHSYKVISGEKSTDLKSVFSLLSLGLVCGTKIRIQVTGPQEKEVCDKLAETFETEFDFPPQ